MERRNGLQHKRVVVVGGSSGIGLAVAEAAASQGAKVVIASSNAERVQKAIKSISGQAQGQAVDVSEILHPRCSPGNQHLSFQQGKDQCSRRAGVTGEFELAVFQSLFQNFS